MSIFTIKNILVFLTIILALNLYVSAQTADISSIMSHRKQQIESNYFQSNKTHQLIKNGKNYYNYYPSTEGHQFLVSKISEQTFLVYVAVICFHLYATIYTHICSNTISLSLLKDTSPNTVMPS